MVNSIQTAWLQQLRQTTHYNRWIVDQFWSELGDRVLEVGCGTGNFTALLAQEGRRVTAIDCNSDYIKTAIATLKPVPGIEFHTSDVTRMHLEPSFTAIVLLDVLEHIADDAALLCHLRSGLQPGGRVILKVPALPWLYSPLDRAIGHYRRYTKRSLQSVLYQVGFTHLRVRYFNLAGIPGWWLNAVLLRQTLPPRAQVSQFDRWVPSFRALEAILPPPIGLSLMAIAS